MEKKYNIEPLGCISCAGIGFHKNNCVCSDAPTFRQVPTYKLLEQRVKDLESEKVKLLEEIEALKKERGIYLLEKYSIWLTKNGYMDTDWKDEKPYAIDEFLKTNNLK